MNDAKSPLPANTNAGPEVTLTDVGTSQLQAATQVQDAATNRNSRCPALCVLVIMGRTSVESRISRVARIGRARADSGVDVVGDGQHMVEHASLVSVVATALGVPASCLTVSAFPRSS